MTPDEEFEAMIAFGKYPHSQGSFAREDNTPRSSNPYPSNTNHFAEWDRGWLEMDSMLRSEDGTQT